jgi:GGDEF domain-containing protein/PAS domain-containing protein
VVAARDTLRTIARVSADPLPFRPTEFAAEHEVFAAGAANALSATLYGARTRAATIWLAAFGLVTFAPLAIGSRNGWAFAGLMLFTIACIARWVAGWMFEQERTQAQPLMIFVLHAAIGTGWSAAGLASIGDGYGHGPTLVLVATAVIAAACVPMFERHRDACWWLLAPLAMLPLSLPFMSPQPWAWPLAAIALGALGAAAWHARLSQAQALHQLEASLRLKVVHAEWKKEQQAAVSATTRLDARERDLAVLFEHAAVGIARVNGYVIEGVNDHLARLLGKPADQWVRRDVLSLFAREHHAALDAVVKGQADQGAALREQVALAKYDGTLRPVEVVVSRGERAGAPPGRPQGGAATSGGSERGGTARLWLVFDAAVRASAPAAAAAPAAETSAARAGPLDRAGLQRRLQAYSDQRQRVTVVGVALAGLDALAHEHGEGAARRVREAIAQRLDAVCRADDAIAMLDDACYAVLMTGEPSDLTLSLMCDRVHSAMATPHTLGRASVQFGVSVDSLRCELDSNKASTALAQIDEFAALARAARQRAAAERMPTAPAAAPAPLMPTPPSERNLSRAPATAALVANDVPGLREEAAIAGKHAARAASPTGAEPVVIDRIHIEADPEDD